MRGFFQIGVYRPKFEENIGTLWRSAYQLGANAIFTIGMRYKHQSTDTAKAHRHIPLYHFEDIDQFLSTIPHDTDLVVVEFGGTPLSEFTHPKRAIYLLGAEDAGVPQEIITQSQGHVTLESIHNASYNVAAAGSIVMYDRVYKS